VIRLLTDSRANVDAATIATIPATLVLALNDALDLRDEADRQAAEKARSG
jgi:hypothetical protein